MGGKNIDNLIVLNEEILTHSWFKLNKRLLIHEVLHLWWGTNSIKFENPVLTEAICEFLALSYLKLIKENSCVKRQLDYKKDKIKEISNYDLRYEKINILNEYKLYSYHLLPLIMWSKNKQINVEKFLTEFYSENKNSFVPFKKGNVLFNSISINYKGYIIFQNL